MQKSRGNHLHDSSLRVYDSSNPVDPSATFYDDQTEDLITTENTHPRSERQK